MCIHAYLLMLRRLLRRRGIIVVGALLFSCNAWAAGPEPLINTVAGTGTSGYSGDNAAATSAELASPYRVAVDSSGNLYIADTYNCRIRKVDTDGIITTVAGKGCGYGYSGDDGLATAAALNYPLGVTVDSSGNLYIADTDNNRIRKFTVGGNITTVAGNGTAGFGGDNGAATSAQLNAPSTVAVDSSGNLYIADKNNHRIRKVGTDGIITTVAGTGTAGYSGDNGTATDARLDTPCGVAVVGSDLYIADYTNHRIRKFTVGGNITTVAGSGSGGYSGDDGAATAAQLRLPESVAVDGIGNLYIADTGNYRIRKVDTDGNITTVAGGGADRVSEGIAATAAELSVTYGVAVDGSDLYIAETNAQRIRKVAPANAAPVAAAVTITGTASVGAILTGTYTYSDGDSDTESGSTYRWVHSADNAVDVGDTDVVTSTATGGAPGSNTYTVTAADRGKYLFYCVTPAADAGTSPGTEACSAGSQVGATAMTFRVNKTVAAGGTGDGSSWANAFVDLNDALVAAASGDQIWVAKAVY